MGVVPSVTKALDIILAIVNVAWSYVRQVASKRAGLEDQLVLYHEIGSKIVFFRLKTS